MKSRKICEKCEHYKRLTNDGEKKRLKVLADMIEVFYWWKEDGMWFYFNSVGVKGVEALSFVCRNCPLELEHSLVEWCEDAK